MPRLRVFLFWLLMLAVPLQGFAAASMGLCGTAKAPVSVAMVDTHASHASHGDSQYDHKMHAHHEAAAEPHQQHATADTHHDAASHVDGFHKCASCAACHAVALMDLVHGEQIHSSPQAEMAEPASAMATQVPRVPDKPPRA